MKITPPRTPKPEPQEILLVILVTLVAFLEFSNGSMCIRVRSQWQWLGTMSMSHGAVLCDTPVWQHWHNPWLVWTSIMILGLDIIIFVHHTWEVWTIFTLLILILVLVPCIYIPVAGGTTMATPQRPVLCLCNKQQYNTIEIQHHQYSHLVPSSLNSMATTTKARLCHLSVYSTPIHLTDGVMMSSQPQGRRLKVKAQVAALHKIAPF